MKRKLRTKILVKDYKLCQDLSEEIEQNYTINVIEPANTCLVMAKVLESVGKTEFYMCEILTTEARVEIDGNLGIGIIMGDSKDQAIQLAIIDSAIKAKLKETAAWEKRLLSANEELLHTEQAAFSIVEKSRVKFDIMEEYFDGIGKKADFDTVHDLQQAYKKMLYALSYPGKIYNVSELSEKISLNFDYNKSLLLLALCIADSEVTISITGDNSNNESAGNYLRNIAYTNIDENRIPDYLILSGDFNVENITDTIAIGTLIDPHKSTTVFIEVEKISDTAQYELSGPGIKDKTNISIDGIFDEFIRLRNTKCRKFPLGFDIFVCDKVGNIIGIPRTTKIDEGSM